jgi:hypothetical protein
MMQHKQSKFDTLVRDEIVNHLVRMFAFNEIDFAKVYSVSPITIIDEITEKYTTATELSNRFGGWDRPFDHLRGEIRFYYGTPYIAHIIRHIAEFFEFMYSRCIVCDERTPCPYCDMEPKDVRKCIERENNRFWADAAAPEWSD